MRIREYKGPLTVLATGVLGFSLFCIVSAAALADPRTPNVSSQDIQPQNIVDSAISNMNTMAALTVEVVAQYIATETPSPFSSSTVTQTEAASSTPTIRPTRTRVPATSTRDPANPLPTKTLTPTHIPTRTSTPIPTNTPLPTDTATPLPTNTPQPTNTPVPTDTPEPPPTATNTPEPPPSDTPQPPPTEPMVIH